MIVDFYRCDSCKRLDEYQCLIKRHGCVCGAKRIRPSRATKLQIAWFVMKNPGYFFKAISEAENG